MPKKPLEALEEHFSKFKDPCTPALAGGAREDRTKDHKLIDIIAIAMCAVICGAEGWTDIEHFGKSKELWLRTFLELPNGIPSHDTFGRVFSMIDAQQSRDMDALTFANVGAPPILPICVSSAAWKTGSGYEVLPC